MIKSISEGEGRRTVFFFHGYKGNINSLKIFGSIFKNFRKVYFQAPFQVEKGKFSWMSGSEDENETTVSNVASMVLGDLNADLDRDIFLGFSQGCFFLLRAAQQIHFQNLVLLCPKFYLDFVSIRLKKVFCYISVNDTTVPFSLNFEGFKKLSEMSNESVLVLGNSGHKLNSHGIKFLKFWAEDFRI